MILAAGLVAGLLGASTTASAATPNYPVPYSFLPAITSGLQPGADPPGANDWSCQPSAAHPEPVVLVHGTFANKTVNWQTTSPLLANRGYCVFALTYGQHPASPGAFYQAGALIPMEESAEQLSDFIDQVLAATGASEVDLVGHSQGTLMPNYYVKFLGGAAKVDDYISIAPLWQGTKLLGTHGLLKMAKANAFTQLFSAPFIAVVDALCGSCRQMIHGSDFLAMMNEGGTAHPDVTYTNIMSKIDGVVVPYTSGILNAPNATNFVVQDQCRRDHSEHATLVASPTTSADVLNALDPAHPVQVPCTLVLPLIGAPFFSGNF